MTIAIAAILMLLATFAFCAALYERNRADNLEQWAESHHDAAQELITHVDALETYTAHLEAVNRHNNAIAAGSMLRMAAVDVGERMTMEEGSFAP